MNPTETSPDRDPAAVHTGLIQHFEREVERYERRERRLGAVRLLLFVGAGVLISAGVSTREPTQWITGAALFAAFLLSWLYRALPAREAAEIRRDVHKRHLARVSGQWQKLEHRGETRLPSAHGYAWDLDIVGPGSLFQRIDVTQTREGECTLAAWLGAAATPEVIASRQEAVSELAPQVEFRQELEASAVRGSIAHGKLDGRSFAEFARLPSLFAAHSWLTPAIFALPMLTAVGIALSQTGMLPSGVWVLPLSAQIALLMWSGRAVRRAFDLAAARQSVVEGFEHMLRAVEGARFQSAHLGALQHRLSAHHMPPSKHMAALKAWASAAELRQQFLFHVFVNPLTLWDLHVLRGLERWNARAGSHTEDWFRALGELEALSSLATLAFGDPDCTMPEIVASDVAFEAGGLAHPLLPRGSRVPNDVALSGPGSALIVTGSNMAGKSTLLRAVGQNVALALCGGPVCARRMRVPFVRLRASMRVQDSLQEGASYFHAELTKLRSVVADAEAEPPIFFLLDELLRGTNTRARLIGAKAVLIHLIERRGSGIVATHDVGLPALEEELPGRVRNVHFTDVVIEGEMRFDYRLRPGAVRTSNALRLLAMAGIEVPAEEQEQEQRAEALDEKREQSPLTPR